MDEKTTHDELREFAEWNRKGAAATKLMFSTGFRVIVDPEDLLEEFKRADEAQKHEVKYKRP